MSKKIVLQASVRETHGSRAVRRLRREEGQLPGVLYGAHDKPLSIQLPQKELNKALESESFFSQLSTLEIAGKSHQVVLKALQRHPFKPRILHVDFFKVSAKEKLIMNIPLRFMGEEECPGVKEGGTISHTIHEVQVRCLPGDLPEYISVDVSALALDGMIHLSELSVPQGVEFLDLREDSDPLVVTVHLARPEPEAEVVEAPEASEVPSEHGGASPEGEESTSAEG